ncbi:MAG: D-alanine--D-alanine ligase [Oscillospiraceae bacterium]|nr:D-alanine--D-alanine ligase [Oscillospiraceae bacterium]
MAKIRVAVIFGGVSSEHDVSLLSAASVIDNIPTDKYEIIQIGITNKGRWLYYPGNTDLLRSGDWEQHADCVPAFISPDRAIHGIVKGSGANFTTQKIDVIFPVLHGKNGEDGTIQGLFELADIPYVGCDVISSANCMDKAVANTLFDAAGIARCKWDYMLRTDMKDFDAIAARIEKKLGYPIFVKPANAGSSVGISKAHNIEELRVAVQLACAHDHKIVFEEAVNGQEVECAVLGNDAPISSTPGEIVACNEFYDYEAKYLAGTSQLFIPARLSQDKLEEVKQAAVEAYKALGCSGLSRCDFFVEKDTGRVLINEINTLPGFTSISMYPKMMEHEGIAYSQLLDKLIALALEKVDNSYE